MKMIRSVLAHVTLVLSGIFLVFRVLDGYNPTMDFIGNPVSKILFFVFCTFSIVNSVILIMSDRKEVIGKKKK